MASSNQIMHTAKDIFKADNSGLSARDLMLNWAEAKIHPWAFIKYFAYTKDQLDNTVIYKKFPVKLIYRVIAELFYREQMMAIVKSRQIMCSWEFAALGLWDGLFGTYDGTGNVAYNKSIFDQSKKEADGDELLDRKKLIYDVLHQIGFCQAPFNMPRLKKAPGDKLWGSYCNAAVEGTGSIFKAFPQGPDIARQVTASLYTIDEAAFQGEAQDAFKAIRPTLGSKGKVGLISTPNGRKGDGGFFYDTIHDVDPSTEEEAGPPLEDSDLIEVDEKQRVEPDSKEERELLEMPQHEFSKLSLAEICARCDGLRYKKNSGNGFAVLFAHYSADPDKSPKTSRGRSWIESAKKGHSASSWRQEYELDFDSFSGRSVIENFSYETFVGDVKYEPGIMLEGACDFGTEVTVAFVAQKHVIRGVTQIQILDEIFLQRKGGFVPNTMILGDRLRGLMETSYQPSWESGHHRLYPDPNDANKTRSESWTTNKKILDELGLHCHMLKYVKIKESCEFIKLLFSVTNGVPGIVISPKCKYLISVVSGGWHYPIGCTDGKPAIDGYFIHGGDTLRYLGVGMVRPRELVNAEAPRAAGEGAGRIITEEYTGRVIRRIGKSRSKKGRAARPLELEFTHVNRLR